MSSFEETYAAWEDAEAAAEQVPCGETRIAAHQAQFALAHHPDANRARQQIQRQIERRSRGRWRAT